MFAHNIKYSRKTPLLPPPRGSRCRIVNITTVRARLSLEERSSQARKPLVHLLSGRRNLFAAKDDARSRVCVCLFIIKPRGARARTYVLGIQTHTHGCTGCADAQAIVRVHAHLKSYVNHSKHAHTHGARTPRSDLYVCVPRDFDGFMATARYRCARSRTGRPRTLLHIAPKISRA